MVPARPKVVLDLAVRHDPVLTGPHDREEHDVVDAAFAGEVDERVDVILDVPSGAPGQLGISQTSPIGRHAPLGPQLNEAQSVSASQASPASRRFRQASA